MSFIHYQRSTVGQALAEALDEMVHSGQIQPTLANRVLNKFDTSVSECLQRVTSKCALKGRLKTYRNCDDVWTFVLRDFHLRSESESVVADKVKIIACKWQS